MRNDHLSDTMVVFYDRLDVLQEQINRQIEQEFPPGREVAVHRRGEIKVGHIVGHVFETRLGSVGQVIVSDGKTDHYFPLYNSRIEFVK